MTENSAIIGRRWPLGAPRLRRRAAGTHQDAARACHRRNFEADFGHAGLHLANVGFQHGDRQFPRFGG